MARQKFSQKRMIEAIKRYHGMPYLIARHLGCVPQTVYNYCDRYPRVKEAMDLAQGIPLDISELRLIEANMRGEAWAVKFNLATKGRKRGYGKEPVEETRIEDDEPFYLNVMQIAPSFAGVYHDMVNQNNVEYVFKGGRGSTKSSFVSEIIIQLLINNPTWHVLALRQVKDTLRDSVYSQLVWAIGYLGLEAKFKTTTNPLEITYKPTGQKIYFRGGDDPMKIKSIKPKFGAINVLWFEELDQFHGQNTIRNIMQSAIRGETGRGYILKSYNPPRTINNWVYKELAIPKDNRYVHDSDYTTVPPDWLGRTFLDEAEYLKVVNSDAYDHEYLGIANSAGGMVFENVEMRELTDDEIQEYDRLYHGLDFGYYPDPAHYAGCYYKANTRELYVFRELRRWKAANKDLYDGMIKTGVTDADTVICDSAEPKSIADLRAYGMAARKAIKGADSVEYSIRWLQSLRAIIIDNRRCPYTADEFLSYEYERTKDGEIISGYPDENNHAIDAIRYATNMIWKQRGV